MLERANDGYEPELETSGDWQTAYAPQTRYTVRTSSNAVHTFSELLDSARSEVVWSGNISERHTGHAKNKKIQNVS